MDVVVNFVIIVNQIHGNFRILNYKMISCFFKINYLVIAVVLVLRQQLPIYVNAHIRIQAVIAS
jgi:hypothetical protein